MFDICVVFIIYACCFTYEVLHIVTLCTTHEVLRSSTHNIPVSTLKVGALFDVIQRNPSIIPDWAQTLFQLAASGIVDEESSGTYRYLISRFFRIAYKTNGLGRKNV